MKYSLVALTLAAIGCGTPALSPNLDQVAIEEAETVELVNVDDSTPRTYCTGVWVSPWQYITAAHCVMAISAGNNGSPGWDPKGHINYYRIQTDMKTAYHDGRVADYNLSSDLALVYAFDPPAHPFARVGTTPLRDGMPLDVIGHPIGFGWSYCRGYVSGYRAHALNADELPMLTLQVATPFSLGNSGGGAFNKAGELAGIASYGINRMNGEGFFSHQSAIRAFLKTNNIQ